MKAQQLAEWLLEHPDFDVSILENDNPNGWPSYSKYDIEFGDIGHSSKVMFIEKGKKIN